MTGQNTPTDPATCPHRDYSWTGVNQEWGLGKVWSCDVCGATGTVDELRRSTDSAPADDPRFLEDGEIAAIADAVTSNGRHRFPASAGEHVRALVGHIAALRQPPPPDSAQSQDHYAAMVARQSPGVQRLMLPADSAHEWQCPSCGATTRARMADIGPDSAQAPEHPWDDHPPESDAARWHREWWISRTALTAERARIDAALALCAASEVQGGWDLIDPRDVIRALTGEETP